MDNATIELTQTNMRIRVALAGMLVVALIVGYIYVTKNDGVVDTESNTVPAVAKDTEEEDVPMAPVDTTPTPTETPLPTETPALAYRNGTYAVLGKYSAPSGAENVGITLALKDDVIVDASGTVETAHPASKKFQELFLGGFKAQVVGKKLSEVSLDTVSGSSLTPKGFADAVLQIRTEAGV